VFDCEESAPDVDAVDFLPGFQGQFPDIGVGAFVCDSGVGAEDVDGAVAFDGLVDAGGDGGLVGDVALEGQDEVVVFWTGGFEVVGCDSAAGG